ncbi:hypothetical protein CJ030_MR1G022539 [Morella rubra]|uniref:Uncharacterized protein n=1 Tax=Morella rubra TaxID=262757 RepID=A0A6A1WNA4_9ROSI|nr:hypothetical protein CJ030_MR1G022539 [Morella rubra]
MARGKHARHSLAGADLPVIVEERRQLILGRLVQMEREARPLELQGLNFEGLMEQLTHWVDSYDVTVPDVTITFSA